MVVGGSQVRLLSRYWTILNVHLQWNKLIDDYSTHRKTAHDNTASRNYRANGHTNSCPSTEASCQDATTVRTTFHYHVPPKPFADMLTASCCYRHHHHSHSRAANMTTRRHHLHTAARSPGCAAPQQSSSSLRCSERDTNKVSHYQNPKTDTKTMKILTRRTRHQNVKIQRTRRSWPTEPEDPRKSILYYVGFLLEIVR